MEGAGGCRSIYDPSIASQQFPALLRHPAVEPVMVSAMRRCVAFLGLAGEVGSLLTSLAVKKR